MTFISFKCWRANTPSWLQPRAACVTPWCIQCRNETFFFLYKNIGNRWLKCKQWQKKYLFFLAVTQISHKSPWKQMVLQDFFILKIITSGPSAYKQPPTKMIHKFFCWRWWTLMWQHECPSNTRWSLTPTILHFGLIGQLNPISDIFPFWLLKELNHLLRTCVLQMISGEFKHP